MTLIRQYRNGLVFFLVLTTAVFLLFSVRSNSNRHGIFQSGLLEAIGSVQHFFLSPVRVFQGIRQQTHELMDLALQNQTLRKELTILKPIGIQNQELLLENNRLRQLLNMPPQPNYRYISAQVVGNSSSIFAKSLVLNAGVQHGIPLDAIVLAPTGLVGRVVRSSEDYSQVLTLQDLNSRIPVMIQRSRVQSIASGRNSSTLQLEFISKDADVRVGDLVLTSGLGGVFVKGLIVGQVEQVIPEEVGLFQKVQARLAVDLDRIEEVNLLVPSLETTSSVQPKGEEKAL
ncbi:MAG: rod shape-determining protein MreC [Magnetococcus sp. DMHC-6]